MITNPHNNKYPLGLPNVYNQYKDTFIAYGHYIGRPSPFGNPFRIGQDGDRETVVRKYDEWFEKQNRLKKQLDSLCGADLICFCAPKLCHGHVLLRRANPKTVLHVLDIDIVEWYHTVWMPLMVDGRVAC